MIVYLLVAGLAVWMVGCALAGYHKRFGLFALVACVGLALNGIWMYLGLQASPLSPPALMAQIAVAIYALGAVGVGWLIGRVVREFRNSRVDPT